jgi:hypothetical protein
MQAAASLLTRSASVQDSTRIILTHILGDARTRNSIEDTKNTMSLVDVFIPLILGSLFVARPQMFFKSGGSTEEGAKKRRRMRTIGYVLWGVAALYLVIALLERSP